MAKKYVKKNSWPGMVVELSNAAAAAAGHAGWMDGWKNITPRQQEASIAGLLQRRQASEASSSSTTSDTTTATSSSSTYIARGILYISILARQEKLLSPTKRGLDKVEQTVSSFKTGEYISIQHHDRRSHSAFKSNIVQPSTCLLYTSDAADE